MDKKFISIVLVLSIVLGGCGAAFAANGSNQNASMTNYKEYRNVQVERAIEDKEYLLDLSKLPEGYNHVNVIVDEAKGTATIEGVSKSSAATIDGVSTSSLPEINLEAYSTYHEWVGDYVTFSLTCKATGGKIKTYSGTAKITTTTGTTLSSFNFTQINNAGTYTLSDEYSAYTGAYNSVILKLSNQSAVDIYGRTGYLVPLTAGCYIR